MAFYYAMAVQLLNENPELLEQLRIEAKMRSPLDTAGFLRHEAVMAEESAGPVMRIAATAEEHALIEAIIAASTVLITEPIQDGEG